MTISDYLELQLLDAVFNAEATGLPIANVYVKLHTSDPGEDGTGGAFGDATRAGPVSFSTAAAGAVANDADIAWTNLSAAGTLSHISLWDNSTAGNCLWSGALTATVTVAIGDNFTIPSGDLDVTLN